MLTQALPYSPQQQQRPLLTNSNSNSNPRSPRRFSLRSMNSTTSITSTSTNSSAQYEELKTPTTSATATKDKPKPLQNLFRSFRQRRRRSVGPKRSTTGTTTTTTDGAELEDDEIEMLSPAERPFEGEKSAAAATAAEVKAKRSSVDSMFSWAAMTIYTYPGAAPVAGWF